MILDLAERTAALAVRSLLREAEAGPKPGLVDRFGPGSHGDMDIALFRRSAAALGPHFGLMVLEAAARAGRPRPAGAPSRGRGETPGRPARAAAAAGLRRLGVEAEAAMLRATGGVNTHKGAIWTMGLLCAAVGSAAVAVPPDGAASRPPSAEALLDEAASIAREILALGDEAPSEAEGRPSHGQAARRDYGLRSAREEASEGFPAIRARALPLARAFRRQGSDEDEGVITVLLGAMAEAEDTCLVARGGPAALVGARLEARRILDSGGPRSPRGAPMYAELLASFEASRLSPGGAADLCAAALFLSELEAED